MFTLGAIRDVPYEMLMLLKFVSSPRRRLVRPPPPADRAVLATIIEDLQLLALERPSVLSLVARVVGKLTAAIRARGAQTGDARQ